MKYAFQYYGAKKYCTSSTWSTLYQCTGEKFPHIFPMIEFCLSTPYSNEIMERSFSFMKVVKSDWHSKLNEENVETLLYIKVEGPEIVEFITENSRDA